MFVYFLNLNHKSVLTENIMDIEKIPTNSDKLDIHKQKMWNYDFNLSLLANRDQIFAQLTLFCFKYSLA